MSGLLFGIVLSVRTRWFHILLLLLLLLLLLQLFCFTSTANLLTTHFSSWYIFPTQPSHRHHMYHCPHTVPSCMYVRLSHVRFQWFNCYRLPIERPKNLARPPFVIFVFQKCNFYECHTPSGASVAYQVCHVLVVTGCGVVP